MATQRKKTLVMPSDPDERAHLCFRLLRQLNVPKRIDSAHCWPATGAVNAHGHARVALKVGADTTLGRAVFAAFCTRDGTLSADWSITNVCRNPRCCRPGHLIAIKGAITAGTVRELLAARRAAHADADELSVA
jgi:hypothetical protein